MSERKLEFNPTFHTKTRPEGKERVCTINLGNGNNEIKFKSFDERMGQHLKDLVDMRPDIVCMQELRYNPDPVKIQPEDFLYQVEKKLGHKTVNAFLNSAPPAFGQAISFDRSKYFLKRTSTHWLSRPSEDGPPHTDVPAGLDTVPIEKTTRILFNGVGPRTVPC